jgi:hypothetical protein
LTRKRRPLCAGGSEGGRSSILNRKMIFVAYSHRDEQWFKELRIMAAPLRKYGDLIPYSDRDVKPGDDWRQSIKNLLDNATIAVLLVSHHFLESKFIMEVELPELLKARDTRGLRVIWVLISDCLFEDTPIESIQSPLSIEVAMDAMPVSKKNAALKRVCGAIREAFERPVLDPALKGRQVKQKMENLNLLLRPSTRRTEIYARSDNSEDWYHQGAVPAGKQHCTCYFGYDKTVPGAGFHITAITTEAPIPSQGGKPGRLPEFRTKADPVRGRRR